MTNVSDYLSFIQLQQATQVRFPKLDNLLFDLPDLVYDNEQAINFILSRPFQFLSCRQIKNNYYWEFYNLSNDLELHRTEFIYVLVNLDNFNSLKSKLPYYATWNKDLKLVYPTTNYLIDSNANSYGRHYTIRVTVGFTHPFLPTFNFTGNVCILSNSLLYEYKDTQGYYGPKGFEYLSFLRPINLNYPLGIPLENQLEIDFCYEEDLKYPLKGDTFFAGSYQGKYTNKNYNKHITFWLYKNHNTTFLLDQPPTLNRKGIMLNALSLIGTSSILIIPTHQSIQTFNINQQSTYTELKIL